MKIALGADHAGFKLKEYVRDFLVSQDHEVMDKGAFSFNADDDYPDFVFSVAHAVARGEVERGIVIGSSGQGEGIAANRVKGIRALVYYGAHEPLGQTSKVGEQKGIIESSREDNDSNILSLGASFVTHEEAKQIIEKWLNTPFTNEERHVRRIQKLDSTF